MATIETDDAQKQYYEYLDTATPITEKTPDSDVVDTLVHVSDALEAPGDVIYEHIHVAEEATDGPVNKTNYKNIHPMNTTVEPDENTCEQPDKSGDESQNIASRYVLHSDMGCSGSQPSNYITPLECVGYEPPDPIITVTDDTNCIYERIDRLSAFPDDEAVCRQPDQRSLSSTYEKLEHDDKNPTYTPLGRRRHKLDSANLPNMATIETDDAQKQYYEYLDTATPITEKNPDSDVVDTLVHVSDAPGDVIYEHIHVVEEATENKTHFKNIHPMNTTVEPDENTCEQPDKSGDESQNIASRYVLHSDMGCSDSQPSNYITPLECVGYEPPDPIITVTDDTNCIYERIDRLSAFPDDEAVCRQPDQRSLSSTYEKLEHDDKNPTYTPLGRRRHKPDLANLPNMVTVETDDANKQNYEYLDTADAQDANITETCPGSDVQDENKVNKLASDALDTFDDIIYERIAEETPGGSNNARTLHSGPGRNTIEVGDKDIIYEHISEDVTSGEYLCMQPLRTTTYEHMAGANTDRPVETINTYMQPLRNTTYEHMTGDNTDRPVETINTYMQLARNTTYEHMTGDNTDRPVETIDTYMQTARNTTYEHMTGDNTDRPVETINTYMQPARNTTYEHIAEEITDGPVTMNNAHKQPVKETIDFGHNMHMHEHPDKYRTLPGCVKYTYKTTTQTMTIPGDTNYERLDGSSTTSDDESSMYERIDSDDDSPTCTHWGTL